MLSAFHTVDFNGKHIKKNDYAQLKDNIPKNLTEQNQHYNQLDYYYYHYYYHYNHYNYYHTCNNRT